MNRDVAGPIYGESRLTEFLISLCREQSWQWSRDSVHPGRDNLLIQFAGNPPPDKGGELLLWDVHQDTVPVEGMTIEPFGGEVRDGRVYGRGSCDVKGSMAAMLAALSRRTEAGARPTIVLVCTVNEECGYTGAKALSRLWSDEAPMQRNTFLGNPTQRLSPNRPSSTWLSRIKGRSGGGAIRLAGRLTRRGPMRG